MYYFKYIYVRHLSLTQLHTQRTATLHTHTHTARGVGQFSTVWHRKRELQEKVYQDRVMISVQVRLVSKQQGRNDSCVHKVEAHTAGLCGH